MAPSLRLGPGPLVRPRRGHRGSGPRPAAGAAEGTGRELLGGGRGCAEDPGVGAAAPPSCGRGTRDSGSLFGEGALGGAWGPGGKGRGDSY